MPPNTPTSNSVEEKVQNHIFNTVNDLWGISQLSKTNLPLPISHIHFIAHPNEDNLGSDGQQPTNHWTMYLETSPTSSVHVDVAPDDTDVAMVMLDTEQVNFDAYNVFHKSLPVTGSLRWVKDVATGSPSLYWIWWMLDWWIRETFKMPLIGLGCIGVFLLALARSPEKLHGVLSSSFFPVMNVLQKLATRNLTFERVRICI
ncbi:uncharacterized protein LACBIDRAFT_329452 [Laccaria bicolor S238N-H82]|uniref:Predicted protein n=1 Tax=Laccaria bicolor (strain S238N-H82 / ATCC MYA-4686) TaxID=486041 RepID=B0DI28_LACBS|nr:uncharacterized protein LACBIDRAFT_329452 [Laccaria bicolor S238N-H82]EDR05932.1 predicted protein [Laccaria bicolor S238N-H82]|eukprot:XP_001883608.1 predicted protein [Laccaria bicolor S238N-H82]